jgi:hypothetical protein
MHHALCNAQRHAIGQPLVKHLPEQLCDDMRLVFIVISVAESLRRLETNSRRSKWL